MHGYEWQSRYFNDEGMFSIDCQNAALTVTWVICPRTRNRADPALSFFERSYDDRLSNYDIAALHASSPACTTPRLRPRSDDFDDQQ